MKDYGETKCEECDKTFTKYRINAKFCCYECKLAKKRADYRKANPPRKLKMIRIGEAKGRTQDPEDQRDIMRKLRADIGFPASDTPSTWRTEDLYKVKAKEWCKVFNQPNSDYYLGFLDMFAILFPDEFSKIELWRVDNNNKVVQFTKANGKPNYKVVYPVLQTFWNAWSEHLGRTPTSDDVYGIWATWLYGEVRDTFMPDFPYSALFNVTTPTSMAPYYRKGAGDVAYDFARDLHKFFLRRDESGRFTKDDWDDMMYMMGRDKFDTSNALLWDDNMSKRWMTEIALPWLGIDPTGFPHDSDNDTIQKCYATSQEFLADIPKYESFCKVTFGIDNAGYGMGRICMHLWPEYDWDDLQFGAVLMGQQRVTNYLRNAFSTVHHEYRMPMRNGKIARYNDTKRPLRIDSFIEDDGLETSIACEVQGGHHYVGYNTSVDERDYRVKLERVQWCDAQKKKKIKRQGHRMVYVPISDYCHPVKGVHGKLPKWNWKLTTEESPKKGTAGLAELFEMQGAKDAARKIRSMIV